MMIWISLAALSILASLFAWCLVRVNKGEDYGEGDAVLEHDKYAATIVPAEAVVRSRLWDWLGFIVAILLAWWAVESILSDAHSQTPTPVQPQHREPYIEPQGPVKPPAKPKPRVQRQEQAQVPCWEVPNGAARTIACANGYWITTMPDGTVVTGMGVNDPNAMAGGSSILINPTTGGPVANGPNVRAPDGTIATPGPGQWWYGHPAPQ